MHKRLVYPNQAYLKECLNYNPDTGVFIWNKRPRSHFCDERIWKTMNSRQAGKVAGCKRHGYITIGIDNQELAAHKIAWIYTYGYNTEHEIDHKDRIRHHNWIDNLRELTRRCNSINQGVRTSNTSGITGVYRNDGKKKKWRSSITVLGKDKFLGNHITYDQAVLARYRGEVENNFPNCTLSPSYKYLVEKGII